MKGKNHILLVEDEAIIAIAEKVSLEKYGYSVAAVNSGEKAVDLIAGDDEDGPGIDLVLMDINLGRGIDGTEAARRIIEMREIPVVFLSSHTEREVVEKTEGISSYGYVVKNSGITVLDAAIKMAFRLFEAKAREKEKEERFQALFNKAPLGYQSLNSEGCFIEVNWSWLETLGYKREEVIGKWFGDFLSPPYREMFRKRFPLFKELGSIHSEFEMVCKNGELISIAFDGKIGYDVDGDFLQTHCILRDITGKTRNERSLKESYTRHSAMIENIADVIAIIDVDGINRYKSPNIERWFGWRPEELVGRDTWENVHPDDRGSMQSLFSALMENEDASGSAECRYRCKDGSFRWINLTAVNLIHNPAIGGLLLNYRDISDRKAVEDEFRENEFRLKEAQKLAHVGSWEYDIASGKIFGSDEGFRIYGLVPPDSKLLPVDEIEACIPEREMVHQALLDLIAEKKPYNLEFEIRPPGGASPKTIISRAELVKDSQGRPLRVRGVFQDITERKKIEETISKQLAEKEVLLKEVHHRIKNNIATVESLLNLQIHSSADKAALSVLQEAAGRVAGMRKLYDYLLISEGYRDISVKMYLEDLVDTVLTLFPVNIPLTVKKLIDDIYIDERYIFPLGVIINELLTNIMKYAFSGRNAGSIQIVFKQTGRSLSLSVCDDGIGLPPGFDKEASSGLGLMLVSMLSGQLQGRFSLEDRNGTRGSVVFDLP